jgi:hypothetical protein
MFMGFVDHYYVETNCNSHSYIAECVFFRWCFFFAAVLLLLLRGI